MDKKLLKVNLSLRQSNESTISSIQEDLLKQELEEIEKKHPMEENQVTIDGTYLVEYKKHVEIGFFVRSTLSSKMNFENIPLIIVNSKGEVILKKVFNMIEFGTLEPMAARPWKIEVDKKDFIKPIRENDWKLQFDLSNNSFVALDTVDAKLENIPENLSYNDKKQLMDFYDLLPSLRTGNFEINIYKVGYNSNKDLCLTLIIRNGIAKAMMIEKLPISIMSKIGVPLVKTVFQPKEPFSVPPKTSIVHTFTFKVDRTLANTIPEKDIIVKFE